MKDLSYYLGIKYPMTITEDDDGVTASNPDLPGCQSFGDSIQEAVDSLAEIRALWLEGYLKAHELAPEPRNIEDYSGKFLIRISRVLHRDLEICAQTEGVSLNGLVSTILSAGLAQRCITETHKEMLACTDQIKSLLHQCKTTAIGVSVAATYLKSNYQFNGLPMSSTDEEVLDIFSGGIPNKMKTGIYPNQAYQYGGRKVPARAKN